jgi:hypothetical protein
MYKKDILSRDAASPALSLQRGERYFLHWILRQVTVEVTMKSRKLLTVSCILILMVSGCAWQQKNIEAKGVFHEFHGIYTMVEPVDLELYRSLLPAPLEMPDQPAVSLFIVDYTEVHPWPMTRYLEGAVFLRAKYNNQEGWHCKTMPVTKWVPNQGGRALGFPKYITRAISLNPDGNTWKGEVKNKDHLKLSLEFSPGLTRTLVPKETALIEAGPGKALADPVFLFVPPDKGSVFQKVCMVNVVPPSWTSEAGMVSITIGPDEPWAGLIAPGTVSPGFFAKFNGAANLVPAKLEEIKKPKQ